MQCSATIGVSLKANKGEFANEDTGEGNSHHESNSADGIWTQVPVQLLVRVSLLPSLGLLHGKMLLM